MNGDAATEEQLFAWLHKIAKKFVFQLEQGNTTGYVHWQGRLSLWKAKRKPELMAMMSGMDMVVPNYLEPTTSVEHKKTAFYCMKEDTRIKGPFKNTDKTRRIPIQYRNIELYPYQEQILASRNELNFRVVDCIIDKSGNNGKSTVANIGALRYGCINLPTVNDGEKIIQSLCDILIGKQCDTPGIVFFDLPRATDKKRLHSMYAAIEQIKTGYIWDTRHSYKEWWFDSPRVWVFTNVPPNTKYLSADRWRFWQIVNRRLMPVDQRALMALAEDDSSDTDE